MMSLRSSTCKFSQWGELCFLRIGGGRGVGLGLYFICRLVMVILSAVGFRIVMYVLGWVLVWNLVRSAIIKGEDGIDR